MPLAAIQSIPENYRVCVVCVDSYERRELRGRFRHLADEREREFESTMGLLLQMEELQNRLNFPQRTTQGRTFRSPAGSRCEELQACPCGEIQPLHGKRATFQVRVIFRQNASWQGSVRWAETGLTRDFRSALELLFLLDDALAEDGVPWLESAAE